MIHNTRQPLECCDRCHKAELLGRGRHAPVFRWNKVDPTPETPSSYRGFHGEQLVATLTRDRKSGPSIYQVKVEGEKNGGLAAGTLQGARVLAEEAYTDVWRQGKVPVRGPVQAL